LSTNAVIRAGVAVKEAVFAVWVTRQRHSVLLARAELRTGVSVVAGVVSSSVDGRHLRDENSFERFREIPI
jgi:hypothetical protein